MNTRLAWLGIGLNPDIWRTCRPLTDENVGDIYKLSKKRTSELLSVSQTVAAEIHVLLKNVHFESAQTQMKKLGIKFITRSDRDYPEELRWIYDPPAVLFTKGTIEKERVRVAIVGSRKCTAYGQRVAADMGSGLAENGIEVVSGMARGIDSAAHKGALKKGTTIAVMGCGLDMIYPPENKRLAEEISHAGALISEFPIGTPPRPLNFPARNRIISGLSSAVVVIEASKRSGALITADFALEQGKEVLAVPGSVASPTSAGCHVLMKQGAGIAESSDDVMNAIGLKEKPKPDGIESIPVNETSLLSLVGYQKTHLEMILSRDGRPPSLILGELSILEAEGLIVRQEGGWYIRVK